MQLTTNQEFDFLTAPLENLNLLEAAAGTGKTYNIQNLVARFLVEKESVRIENILVTTFTNAAAAELKNRIRGNLLALLQELDTPLAAPEESSPLLAHFRSDVKLSDQVIRDRLNRALLEFDLGSICTIHSFCHRVLTDYSFESNFRFAPELKNDDSELLQELLLDFYRNFIYTPNRQALRLALGQKWPGVDKKSSSNMLDRLEKELREKDNHPDLTRWHVEPPAGLTSADAAIIWLDEQLRQLMTAPWDKYVKKFNRVATQDNIDTIKNSLEQYNPETFETKYLLKIAGFNRQNLENHLPKTPKPDSAELLDGDLVQRCTQIDQLLRAFPVMLLRDAEAWIAPRRRAAHEQENSATFNSIIRLVVQALEDDNLVQKLQAKFKVGIIDEFQDTDSFQYKIFKKIFVDTLFLVGDPRQAIYGFRGGDLATYFQAKQEILAKGGRVYTLSTNYRSAARLIDDLNALYARNNLPFGTPQLTLPLQKHRLESDAPALLDQGKALEHPLQIVNCHSSDNEADSKQVFKTDIAPHCARLIRNMLSSLRYSVPPSHHNPARRLEPGDITVLTHTWGEAEVIFQELKKLHVPSVKLSSQNVFLSEDAAELRTVLGAIAQTDYDKILIQAAVTPLIGYTFEELNSIVEDDPERLLENLHNDIRELAQCWQEKSFFTMFNLMLQKFNIQTRYADFQNGERKLTNLFQLADLLQGLDEGGFNTPQSLLRKMDGAIAEAHIRDSEEQKELRTNESSAVILNTIHSSKGLEYPVVFLPTLGNNISSSRQTTFHDANHIIRDLIIPGEKPSPKDETPDGVSNSKSNMRQEVIEEQLRLGYVALTRGSLLTVAFRQPLPDDFSVLEWLMLKRTGNNTNNLDLVVELHDAAGNIVSPTPTLILPETGSDYTPEPPDDTPLFNRKFDSAWLSWGWQMLSYSKLYDSHLGSTLSSLFEEKHDDDAEPNDSATLTPETANLADVLQINAAPAAAQRQPETVSEPDVFNLKTNDIFGNAVHKIFELINFADAAKAECTETQKNLVERVLHSKGFLAPQLVTDTLNLVRQTLQTPLVHSEIPHDQAFRLCDLDPRKILREAEFLYEIKQGFKSEKAFELGCQYMNFSLEQTQMARKNTLTGGFMVGDIDLLFEHEGRYYILDWKTNNLGDAGNYAPAQLRIPMRQKNYFMQFLIYSTALLRLLRFREPGFDRAAFEQKFGGVFYLFVQGLSPEAPGRGIFYNRPDYDTLVKMEDIIG